MTTEKRSREIIDKAFSGLSLADMARGMQRVMVRYAFEQALEAEQGRPSGLKRSDHQIWRLYVIVYPVAGEIQCTYEGVTYAARYGKRGIGIIKEWKA